MVQHSGLPDLAEYKCTHFLMRGIMPSVLGSQQISEVVGQRITQRNPFQLEETYNSSGSLHVAHLGIVRPSRRQMYQLFVHIDCQLGGEEISEPSSITELMGGLTDLGFESEFTYDVLFVLGSKASRRIFPLKLPLGTETIIDEFRGLRGVKLDEGHVSYQLSLDSPQLQELYVNLEMRRRERFHSALLTQTVRESFTIVEGIIPESDWGD